MGVSSRMNAGQGQVSKGDNPPVDKVVTRNAFVRSSIKGRQRFSQSSKLLDASSTPVGPVLVPTYGYMRGVRLMCTGTGSSDVTGANAAFAEDGPFNVLDNITLKDTTGNAIIAGLTGYECYLIHKYGGYHYGVGGPDPKSDPNYSATSGATGNWNFDLCLPVEITARDGFGALANLTTAAQFQLSYSYNANSVIYSVVPDAVQATATVVPWLEAWSQPESVDPFGVPNETAPPGLDAVQYWAKEVNDIIIGENRIRIRTMGNHIRNLIFIFRNTTPARNSTNFPAEMRVEWDNQIIDYMDRTQWQNDIFRTYGLTPDTGVFPWCRTDDADGTPGNENRHAYLPTSSGTRLDFIGTFGAAGTLTVLVNHVAAPTGVPRLSSGNPGN